MSIKEFSITVLQKFSLVENNKDFVFLKDIKTTGKDK